MGLQICMRQLTAKMSRRMSICVFYRCIDAACLPWAKCCHELHGMKWNNVSPNEGTALLSGSRRMYVCYSTSTLWCPTLASW